MLDICRIDIIATNKRVGCWVGQCSLFESYDSNGWSVCLWRDRSDPAACSNITGNNFTKSDKRNFRKNEM